MALVNSWWEIKVICDPALEETVYWRFDSLGSRGTATQQRGSSLFIRTYFPQVRFELLDLSAIALLIKQDALCTGLPLPRVDWQLIEEEDWSKSWKEYWHPQPIGDRFLINPAWLPPPTASDRLVLQLDPGVAFGTGSHPTTQLCLESLEMRFSQEEAGVTFADIGCGSGILSIGALLLGAERGFAVDTDEMAINSAINNRTINQIAPERLSLQHGSLDLLIDQLDQPVNGIFCNILADVILELIPDFEHIARSGTWGILSGILLDQSKLVADTLEQHGWIVATLWRRQEWCCLNIRRP